MPKPYPSKFRDDVVRVARNREPGVTIEQIARGSRNTKPLGFQQSSPTPSRSTVPIRRDKSGPRSVPPIRTATPNTPERRQHRHGASSRNSTPAHHGSGRMADPIPGAAQAEREAVEARRAALRRQGPSETRTGTDRTGNTRNRLLEVLWGQCSCGPGQPVAISTDRGHRIERRAGTLE